MVATALVFLFRWHSSLIASIEWLLFRVFKEEIIMIFLSTLLSLLAR